MGPAQARPPRLASRIGRFTLRAGGYPGRGLVGTFIRKKARQRGGRSFTVNSHDSTRLAAWFSPATPRPDIDPSQPRRLPIVLSHGWCEVKEFHFHRAQRLNDLGHDVVLFDHRGHGRSGGRYVTFGVRERGDLQCVADAAIDRGFIQPPMVTLGFSLGASTVLQHAPLDPRVAGVIAFAPFSDFRAAILSFRDCLAPWMNTAWLLRGFEHATREHGFELDDATTLHAMRSIKAPVLMVEAGRDRNLPPCDHTQKLIPHKTRGPIEVFRVPSASHRSLCHTCWPGLDERVAAFCDLVARGLEDRPTPATSTSLPRTEKPAP
jgi:pimeloyl-ACP methyl ester carboxylesterase